MEAVAKSVTDNFNQAINQGKLTNILKSLNVTITEQEQITEQLYNSVVQNNVYINKAPVCMDYVMTPSFLSIAAYASILITSSLVLVLIVWGKWSEMETGRVPVSNNVME